MIPDPTDPSAAAPASSALHRLLRSRAAHTAQLVVALALLVCLTYANHFRNAFHFDDVHTVVDNLAIRSLRNLPRFFTDVSTFSVLPTHQVYRPLVTASLAFDYWVAGGTHPWAFHASTFVWFLVLAVVLALLYESWFGHRGWAPVFAAALFALHPVSAETVNYVIQRADLYSTLGVAAALAVYIRRPAWRRYGIYLVPFVLACLSKPTALVFPLLILVYMRLYETGRWPDALKSSAPAFLAAGLAATLLGRMNAATVDTGGGSVFAYWITQTWVTLTYIRAFFWPNRLSADTDAKLLQGFPPQAALGIALLATLAAVAVVAARRPQGRPIAMGLAWFGIALLPTALVPLAEVSNDHRMFFPFVGLTAAVVWALRLAFNGERARRWASVGAAVVLVSAAWATHERNRVWRTDESLWLDVTQKSPTNARGLMNYGLTQMSRGDYATALATFERAEKLSPDYWLLEVNLGIAKGALERPLEAEAHFRRAASLNPQSAASHFYYGRWLVEKKRYTDAIVQLDQAVRIQPADLPARHLLMRAYFDVQDWGPLRTLVADTLRLDGGDALARDYRARLDRLGSEIAAAEVAAAGAPTAETYLSLSLQYYRAGRYNDCISAAREALRLKPDYARAHNNIAAAFNAMQQWDNGIAAARAALEVDPSNELARNNLAWALSQKRGQ